MLCNSPTPYGSGNSGPSIRLSGKWRTFFNPFYFKSSNNPNPFYFKYFSVQTRTVFWFVDCTLCASTAICTTFNSTHFMCNCSNGFSGDGLSCNDVNECLASNGGCHMYANCTNTVGSRTCQCNNGYTGNGLLCFDIDECLSSNGGCNSTAICTNSLGRGSVF